MHYIGNCMEHHTSSSVVSIPSGCMILAVILYRLQKGEGTVALPLDRDEAATRKTYRGFLTG